MTVKDQCIISLTENQSQFSMALMGIKSTCSVLWDSLWHFHSATGIFVIWVNKLFFFFVICCLTMFSISKRFQVVFYVCAEIKCRSRSCEVCCPAVLSLSHLEPITKHQYIDWSKCLSVLLCKHTVGLAVHVLSAWILSGFKSFSSSAPLIVAILAFEPRIWITPPLRCLALGFLSVMCAFSPPSFFQFLVIFPHTVHNYFKSF